MQSKQNYPGIPDYEGVARPAPAPPKYLVQADGKFSDHAFCFHFTHIDHKSCMHAVKYRDTNKDRWWIGWSQKD
jgi:hypothetical protein